MYIKSDIVETMSEHIQHLLTILITKSIRKYVYFTKNTVLEFCCFCK